MMWSSTRGARVALGLLFSLFVIGDAAEGRQARDIDDLRERLRDRFSVVALQDGLGLLPREGGGDVRIIEIRNGAVAVNGDPLTGAELRDRLGDDADLVLPLTYLGAAERQQIVDTAPPAAPAETSGTSVERTERLDEVVRVMGDVRVEAHEHVEGDVVAVMGSAYIDGQVDGDVNVVMGNVSFGPAAVVAGDVNVVGGTLERAPGARLEGEIHNVGVGGGAWTGGWTAGRVRDSVLARLGSLAGTILRVMLVGLLALAVVALGRSDRDAWIPRIADLTAAEPLRAGLVGFAAQLLFIPMLVITVVVLAVSIVGIPLLLLLPFALLLLVVVLLVGFTGVAYGVGRALNGRFGWSGRGDYVTVMLGVLAIALITIIARSAAVVGGGFLAFPLSAVGYVVEYVAWTLGFGAALLAWLHRRRTPPPLPSV